MTKRKVYLLDSNVLIEPATPEHSTGIVGHRQVTDGYRVLLARKHGGSVATMDQALAAVHAGTTLVA